MFNLKPSLIRFWEKEFPMLNPKKNRRGIRQYTKEDIVLINQIYVLVKARGYTLEGARLKLQNPSKSTVNQDIVNNLMLLRNKLSRLKDQLSN